MAHVYESGHEPVYNLTVAECHEFFANGVLVHNCDALRYGLCEIAGKRRGDNAKRTGANRNAALARSGYA